MWSLGSSVATWHESQERRDKDKGSQGDTICKSLEPAVAAAPHILFQFDKIDFVAGAE
jgi:hypothetical protein